MSAPSATTNAAPRTVTASERTAWRPLPVTMPAAVPRIGVPSGAMIMAPMTAAVAFVTTPAAAMTAARPSRIQNRDCLPATSPWPGQVRSVSSARLRRWPPMDLHAVPAPMTPKSGRQQPAPPHAAPSGSEDAAGAPDGILEAALAFSPICRRHDRPTRPARLRISIRYREHAARDGEHLPAEPTRTELAHLRAAITLVKPDLMRSKSVF